MENDDPSTLEIVCRIIEIAAETAVRCGMFVPSLQFVWGRETGVGSGQIVTYTIILGIMKLYWFFFFLMFQLL